NCCVRKRVLSGPSYDPNLVDTQDVYEDRYIEVAMFGELKVPSNSIPLVAQCDVSGAETQLERRLNTLNAGKYSMCNNGLDLSADSYLDTKSKLLESLPSGVVNYTKGTHESLVLHAGSNRYILHPQPR